MEGAAIAHICYMNSVPYVIIRNISDSSDGSADISFTEFCKTAAEHSGKIDIGNASKYLTASTHYNYY